MNDAITVSEYRSDISEHRLQAMVVDHMRIAAKPDVTAVALPNAARRSYRLGARMKAEGLTPGAADLLIMLPQGRCGWLEMKTIKGRQSIEQKGFQARCLRLGHPYALARTFDEAISVLRTWGALK